METSTSVFSLLTGLDFQEPHPSPSSSQTTKSTTSLVPTKSYPSAPPCPSTMSLNPCAQDPQAPSTARTASTPSLPPQHYHPLLRFLSPPDQDSRSG